MERLYDEIPKERFLDVEENYKVICENINEACYKAGRDPKDIIFMAVTKTVPVELINHAIDLGITHIGENRVQELLSKYDRLKLDNCQAHIIGHLQTNKVGKVIGKVSMIQSVDSEKVAEEIDRLSEKAGIVTDVLVEVNIGQEESKSGISAEKTVELLEKISKLKSIKVKGLMTIPPFCDKMEDTMVFLSNMQKLFVDISAKNMDNISMQYLSMGMSSDYKEAIACGANIVRIGTALFGARNYK